MPRKPKPTDEFWRQISYLRIQQQPLLASRAANPLPTDQGIRLYSTASSLTHGKANARYTLQMRAPLTIANGGHGKQFMTATASLGLADLKAIRAAVDAAIADIETTGKDR